MTDQYKVICSGNILDGFDRAQVQQAFSDLFKLSPDKANAFLNQERTLKKDLSQAKAEAYKNKLQAIGVETRIEPMASAGFTLALEPIEDAPAESSASPQVAAKTGLALEAREEPSGGAQSAGTDQAEAAEPYVSGDFRKPAEAVEEEAERDWEDKLNLPAIGAAAIAAFAGALVWKIIASVFYYEHSLVAIGIGLLVGYAALIMGSRGDLCGIVCAVLALVSILGGKYWAMDSILSQGFEEYAEEQWLGEEMQLFNDEMRDMARVYVNEVHSEDDLRRFMVNYEYTDSYDPDEILQEDIDYFRQDVDPMLQAIASGDTTASDWMQRTYESELDNLSTWDLVNDSLGFIDFLFFFFGAGAAFKLASGRMGDD